MINKDRIVPVIATDLLTLYGVILKQDTTNNSTLAKLNSLDVEGSFKVTSGSAPLLATQPLKTCDIDATTSSVSAATIYFVPSYGYEGFTVDGVKATYGDGSVTVDGDGNTLYKATFGSSKVTITKVGL